MRVLKFTALVAITAAIAGCESEVYHEREHVYHDQPRVYQRTDHYYDSDYNRPRAEARVDVQSDSGYSSSYANSSAYSSSSDNAYDNGASDVIVEQPDDQDVQYFQNDLAPYGGQWVDVQDYGRVWRPKVDRDWQPYTRGHWVYTQDVGWLWASEEPFGDITCHYGRWYNDQSNGWVWVPGTTWAPSWTASREGNGVFAWAPLPPVRRGEANVSVDMVFGHIPANHYVYADEPTLAIRACRDTFARCARTTRRSSTTPRTSPTTRW